MSIHRFFYDPKLSTLSARLDSNDLTISEIRKIEDEVFFLISEENQEFTSELFGKLFVKRSDLFKKELDKLAGNETLCARCERLKWMRSEMSLEALDETLNCLECEAALSNQGSYEAEEAERLVSHYRLLQDYPVLEELEKGALISNFRSRLETLKEEVLASNSLEPLTKLSEAQNKEIFRYANQRGVA